METGTLKELNLKPGDVVEYTSKEDCFSPGSQYIVDDLGQVKDDEGDTWPLEPFSIYPSGIFKVISRAKVGPI